SIMQQLAEPTDLPLVSIAANEQQPPPRSNLRREEFERVVERAKVYIRAGDIFQVVLSQRFESPFDGEPLDFYRCLRFINPSPYMFCLKFGNDFALVGSSPEMHVRLVGNIVEIRPIAGTRARGVTPAQDEANGADLPAGTVSGAPKIRAMQIISELENTRRGCYAGAIGYFGFDGNFDSCIALRCAVLKNEKAYFQAGAGIVADSHPEHEYEETVNKA